MVDESESAAQRRLWFLHRLLEKMGAEQALDMAVRMEAFVAMGGEATNPEDDRWHSAAQNTPTGLPTTQARNFAGSLDQSSSAADPPPPATMRKHGAGRLLNDGEIQAFMTRAVQGATNRELARLFGLTPRQANGIRMALAKRNRQVALNPAPAATP